MSYTIIYTEDTSYSDMQLILYYYTHLHVHNIYIQFFSEGWLQLEDHYKYCHRSEGAQFGGGGGGGGGRVTPYPLFPSFEHTI